MVVAACSETYEIIEWVAASLVSPEAAMAFLGTQGDVFDAQKDSALAALGAIITAVFTASVRKRRGVGVRKD
jgi:putative membrane protein